VGCVLISVNLARKLAAAGLEWAPANGDRFFIPDRDLDKDIFSISEMTIGVRSVEGGKEIAFNGAVEWALDAIEQHEVVWMPSESQLRAALGPHFVSLWRTTEGFACVANIAEEHRDYAAMEAADAYALALLDHLQT